MKLEQILDLGYTHEDIQKIKAHYMMRNYVDNTLYCKMVYIYKYLLSLSFNHKEVLNITRTFMGIFGYEIDTLNIKIKELMLLGYEYEDIKKMIKENPKILSVGIENIKVKINFMKDELGYKCQEIIKMTKKNSSIFEFSIDNLKEKINNLMSLGYTFDEVKKITKAEPLIYKYDIEYIKKKLNDLMSLGYTYNDVLKMLYKFPAIFNMNIDTMRMKVCELLEIGFSYEQIMNMTKILPTILGSDIEKIRLKKEFMDSIGLPCVYINDPMQLMQGIELIYARYKFFLSVDVQITEENYRFLFMHQSRFFNKYGITNKQLIEKYNYNEDYGINKSKR